MAITTLDGVISGSQTPFDFIKVGATMEAAGVWHSMFYNAGTPGAAATPSPGLNGAALTSYAGQIPWYNPASGNSYLSRLTVASTAAGTLRVLDRLWHNSGLVVTTTTAQTFTSAAWPARDRNGSTNGEDISIALEVSTATTNASPVTTITASYTNSDGTAGRTATMASFPATAVAGTFVPFQLQAGDIGVRSVQSVTLGTSLAAGAVHVVAYDTFATVACPVPNVAGEVNAITGGFPRLWNNTVPFLVWVPSSTTAVTLVGAMSVAQG